MNAVVPLAFGDSMVRVVRHQDDDWFVGKDVCQALGHRNHKDALARLDADERDGVGITDPIGRMQETTVITEPGVWRLVLRSRVEAAQQFKRWFAHEVLPTLRKTGPYAVPGTADTPPSDGLIRDRELRLETVAEARRLYGAARARHLWEALGLPKVPPLPDRTTPEAREADDRSFAADPIAEVIRSIAETRGTWTGTPAQLFDAIAGTATPVQTRHRLWPRTVQALGYAINRARPVLARRGVLIERRHSGVRTITIGRAEAIG